MPLDVDAFLGHIGQCDAQRAAAARHRRAAAEAEKKAAEDAAVSGGYRESIQTFPFFPGAFFFEFFSSLNQGLEFMSRRVGKVGRRWMGPEVTSSRSG
jgi:hypothetical protein